MDDVTFTGLYRECAPSLYRVSVSLLRSVPDAQDAVQQALLKAWAARDKMWPGHGQAWLMRIVVRECRNIQRYRMRVTPVERVEDAPWSPPDPSLREAVDGLPEALRLPLLLMYMEGMSEQEAARALRLSVSAVKSRLYRARRALEKRLREEVELL